MKLITFCLALIISCGVAFGQQTYAPLVESPFTAPFGQVLGTGALPSAMHFGSGAPSVYAFDWFNDGTAPIACTFYPEWSSDGRHWNILLSSDATGATVVPFSCTSAGSFVVAFKPAIYVRARVVSYTAAGNATDAVIIRFTKGGN